MKMRLKNWLGVALIGVMPLGGVQAEDTESDLAVTIPRLSMEVAQKMAMNAILACREKGISVSATVVDRSGNIQAQLRDTIAPPVSLGISYKKAFTAVNFNVKGSQLIGNLKTGLPFADSRLVMMAGSVPIKAGGKLYGAIGVSGAPEGKVDEQCALAGFESMAEDLEMM
ncbi:GlcG/HbpS family heme-binding protein [Galenea microaerophila]